MRYKINKNLGKLQIKNLVYANKINKNNNYNNKNNNNR